MLPGVPWSGVCGRVAVRRGAGPAGGLLTGLGTVGSGRDRADSSSNPRRLHLAAHPRPFTRIRDGSAMTTGPDTPPPDRPGGARAWARPAIVVVSCLVIGFVAGWVLRGDEGTVTVLAPPDTPADTGGAATGETPATAPGTTTAEAPPPPREEIRLAVLNGTDEAGLAGRTADQAESLGYTAVEAGNAPPTGDPPVVYHREGQRPAAQRVARDLQVGQVRPLPASGPLAAAAPDGAQVVLVLGSG